MGTNTHVSTPSKDYKILTTFNVIKTHKVNGVAEKNRRKCNVLILSSNFHLERIKNLSVYIVPSHYGIVTFLSKNLWKFLVFRK